MEKLYAFPTKTAITGFPSGQTPIDEKYGRIKKFLKISVINKFPTNTLPQHVALAKNTPPLTSQASSRHTFLIDET